MATLVISGAKLKCSKGTSSSTLTVLPTNLTEADETPAATVMDYKPMVNVAPFGRCKTRKNPQVAVATANAKGVLTPMPCIPVISAPWSPGASVVMINDEEALTKDSTCTCAWSGSIEVTDPGTGVEVD